MNANGSFWHATAGTTANVLTAKVTGSASGDPAITYDEKDVNQWLTSFPIAGADPAKSYTYTITVTDSFGSHAQLSFNLPVSNPIFWIGKHTVRIRNHLIVDRVIKSAKGIFTESVASPKFIGNLQGNADTATHASTADNATNATHASTADSIPLDKIYPVGSIYLQIGTTTNPASLFGGSWANLDSSWRMLLAGPQSAGNGWTGGRLYTNDTAITSDQSGLRGHSHSSGTTGFMVWNNPNGQYYYGGSGENYTFYSRTANEGWWNAAAGHHHDMDWQPFITITAWKRVG